MLRLFVALPLPEALRERLATLCDGVPGARWVEPENLHLTLRFVGEIDGRAAQDLDAALAEIDAPGFEMALAGLGTFGEGRKLRVLWVGVEAPEALGHLQAKVESAAQRSGLELERRRFRPHVTLARFSTLPGDRLGQFMMANNLFRSQPFGVDRFCLYSSHLSSEGPIYRVEAEYPLQPPEPQAASGP